MGSPSGSARICLAASQARMTVLGRNACRDERARGHKKAGRSVSRVAEGSDARRRVARGAM